MPASFSADPQAVPGVTGALGVAVSDTHACAFTSSGDVYCWGANASGQSGPVSAPTGTCLDQDNCSSAASFGFVLDFPDPATTCP